MLIGFPLKLHGSKYLFFLPHPLQETIMRTLCSPQNSRTIYHWMLSNLLSPFVSLIPFCHITSIFTGWRSQNLDFFAGHYSVCHRGPERKGDRTKSQSLERAVLRCRARTLEHIHDTECLQGHSIFQEILHISGYFSKFKHISLFCSTHTDLCVTIILLPNLGKIHITQIFS